jgi:hypothetical protein
MLGLAASDMRQAEEAAKAIPTMTPIQFHLRRVLETGLVVAYSRAFTKSTIVTLRREDYEPADPRLADLHGRLIDLRDTVGAHTDKDADRRVSVQQGHDGSVGVGESFGPVLSPEDIALAPTLFEVQRQRFLDETTEIGKELGDIQ